MHLRRVMTLKSLSTLDGLAAPMAPMARIAPTAPAARLDGWKLHLQDNALSLDPLDGARFIRILSESRLIGRQTELLAWLDGAAAMALRDQCGGALHGALESMRCVLVHGVRDKRSGCDSLYIALDAR